MKNSLNKGLIFGIVLSLFFMLFSGTLNVISAQTTSETGLVGYWKFDEGSGDIAYDSSGNNNYGTIRGTPWTDHTLAIDHDVVTDASKYAWTPSVIKDGNTYKMWWSAQDGTNAAIYYSTSNDGISWTGHTLAIDHGVVPDASNYAYTPSVIKDSGTYKMWWTAHDGTNYHIYYSTSTDGITWGGHTLAIDHGVVNDASSQAGRPSVIKDGGIYKMWWSASDATNLHIYYSTSTNGISWSGHTLAIDHGVVTDASLYAGESTVLKDGDIYKMWWCAYDGTNWNIYYSTSTDGISWTGHTLVIDHGVIPDASNDAYHPSVIKDGGVYKMWWTAHDVTNGHIYYSVNEGPEWVDGISGKALYFWGDIDKKVTVPSSDEIRFTEEESFTLEAWIKPEDTPGIIIRHGEIHTSPGYKIELSLCEDYDEIYFGVRTNENYKSSVYGYKNIYDGRWHYLAGVRDTSKGVIQLYVDGKLIDETTDNSKNLATSANWGIGGSGNLPRPRHSFDGIIDEVRIWNRALSKDEIFKQYLDAFEVKIDIDPNTLNLKSNEKWITCYIELAEWCDVNDIDISTIKLNNVVNAEMKPTSIGDYDNDNIPDLMLKFNRKEVCKILEPENNVEIKISGKVGIFDFEGIDIIRVIEQGKK